MDRKVPNLTAAWLTSSSWEDADRFHKKLHSDYYELTAKLCTGGAEHIDGKPGKSTGIQISRNARYQSKESHQSGERGSVIKHGGLWSSCSKEAESSTLVRQLECSYQEVC